MDNRNNKFSEEQLEKAIIELFVQQGYDYVHGEEIHRKYNDILLTDDMKSFILKKYAKYNLTENEIERIINKIKSISYSFLYDGNRKTFWLINEGFDLERDDTSKVAVHIDYIDYENIENNIFKVINQYTVQDEKTRRPDLLIFINGIPLVICEFKSAIKEDTTIYDAWKQIRNRYNRDIPKLMRFCALSLISDGANTKLGSIYTPYEYYYSWNKANDEETVANGISSLITMINGAFAKDRLIKILQDFIFYPDDSQKNEAIVCRYPQFFGAVKMYENIKSHLKPHGDGKGGTYFGATGCGKTYTMLYLARLLIKHDSEIFNNSTIIIITDREDLDTQTTELFVTATKYLHERDVRSIESRDDLQRTLKNKPSGGIYITTIQKFCESIGMLSDRSNIICISDEAHRTQTGIGSKVVKKDNGVYTTYGFAYYLRNSFPNATYCGFTGTPIDETISVFGDVVDSYTMKESTEDGITVRITYEPRLAKVLLDEQQAKEIQAYYNKCADLGSTPEQIEESQRAMSKMTAILGNPERLEKVAADIVEHYTILCSEKPEITQKAMIVCANRQIAFNLLQEIYKIKPEWTEAKRSENEDKLSKEQLEKLQPLPKVNLVATQDKDDEDRLYKACGSKKYRQMLDKQFKNNNSNFKIAIVVDMWITGFDVPSLAVMYVDKPLQKHTLIQTISRVNRVFIGKNQGLVVDYIGIKDDMLKAIKQYGSKNGNPIDELKITLDIFRNHLSLVSALFSNFDDSKFFNGTPVERLYCLNNAAEYIQIKREVQIRFMGLSLRLKNAYMICNPSGELTAAENEKAQFYLAIRSILYKQTKGDAPDAEIMNSVVENMVANAISCTGIEDIFKQDKSIDLFSDKILYQLDKLKMPITKFNALLKIIQKDIKEYSKTNKIKAKEFDERLKNVVDRYNNRDSFAFTNEVLDEFINELSGQLIDMYKDIENDKQSFYALGITFEEKAFYDILIKVRDNHKFEYEDNKCIELAKKIKELVDDKSQYADWHTRNDIKNQLSKDLFILLYQNSYPPEWNNEVFDKVMEQTENFKMNVI